MPRQLKTGRNVVDANLVVTEISVHNLAVMIADRLAIRCRGLLDGIDLLTFLLYLEFRRSKLSRHCCCCAEPIVWNQRQNKKRRVKQQKRVSRTRNVRGEVGDLWYLLQNVSVSYLCNYFVSVFVLKYNSEIGNFQIITTITVPFISQQSVVFRPACPTRILRTCNFRNLSLWKTSSISQFLRV